MRRSCVPAALDFTAPASVFFDAADFGRRLEAVGAQGHVGLDVGREGVDYLLSACVEVGFVDDDADVLALHVCPDALYS